MYPIKLGDTVLLLEGEALRIGFPQEWRQGRVIAINDMQQDDGTVVLKVLVWHVNGSVYEWSDSELEVIS